MKIIKITLILIFTFSHNTYADKVVLKNGRVMEANKIIKKSKSTVLYINGNTVEINNNDIAEVIARKPVTDEDRFSFEKWHSGMDIRCFSR